VNAVAAISDSRGTTLPWRGAFLGVNAPLCRVAVINGELSGTSRNRETRIYTGSGPRACSTVQTGPVSEYANQFLSKLELQVNDYATCYSGVSYASFASSEDVTDSVWQGFRRTFEPLKEAANELLSEIEGALTRQRVVSAQARHAGLAAVSRLVGILGLSRPTILKMAGVPNSTFYSWQNNPQAVIRTPTVSRLLRLQAQVALLDEMLGRNRMRDWMLSSDHFDKLQGNETAFAQVLAEAEGRLRELTQIKPRPRMRPSDYESQPVRRADDLGLDGPFWPGAAKMSEEQTGGI
jgi:hypothetical protein